jgi:hypothetical protein
MTAIKAVKFKSMIISIGDGATPEVFVARCSLNSSRGLEFKAKTEQTNLPDCDDPDLVGWAGVQKSELSCSMDGEGTLHINDNPLFFTWFTNNVSMNCKIILTSGAVTQTYTGKFMLVDYSVKAQKGQYVNASLKFEADGEVVLV